jgi:hypothetical protein
MKKPSAASLKKVTPENLIGLGAERLAGILAEVAETRVDLKRRLRMELAADLGPEHLVPEIDKRLQAFETSKGQITWRQKPAFIRDLDALRALIVRLARGESDAAAERLWRFLAAEPQVGRRLREREDAVEAVYLRAAADLGHLLALRDPQLTANALVEAAAARPQGWARWLPAALEPVLPATAALALVEALALALKVSAPGWSLVLRHLADAAGDIEAVKSTYSPAALKTPAVAVQIARRHLAVGELDDAGEALRQAAPKPGLLGRLPAPDFDWETAWIDYLQAAGQAEAAQAIRWASFQRTLDIGRAKAFAGALDDFDDVAAEAQAFDYAAQHADFEQVLDFLMQWPALAEASRMILSRPDDIKVDAEKAELWAGKLRRRFPVAAHQLLRRAATAAFKRREFKTSERLAQEADSIDLPA